MNLALAKAAYLEEQAEPMHQGLAVAALELLYTYFSNLPLKELRPETLRQFLSVWYLEEAVSRSTSAPHTDNFPDALTMLACLTEFFSWLAKAGTDNSNSEDLSATAMPETGDATMAQECLGVLRSLQETLPRAIAINGSLTDSLANRGGAFAFPEFLTSFEEGGQSAYDIGDVSGEASAIEGYFQILEVDGARVEAQELISERAVSPILFPEETAALLDIGYLINLELVLFQGKWQIANCGFAYPPGADF
jgi:hypothetical protein